MLFWHTDYSPHYSWSRSECFLPLRSLNICWFWLFMSVSSLYRLCLSLFLPFPRFFVLDPRYAPRHPDPFLPGSVVGVIERRASNNFSRFRLLSSLSRPRSLAPMKLWCPPPFSLDNFPAGRCVDVGLCLSKVSYSLFVVFFCLFGLFCFWWWFFVLARQAIFLSITYWLLASYTLGRFGALSLSFTRCGGRVWFWARPPAFMRNRFCERFFEVARSPFLSDLDYVG